MLKSQIGNICYRAYNSFKYRILRVPRILLEKALGMCINKIPPKTMGEYWIKDSNRVRFLFLSLFKAYIYTISQKKIGHRFNSRFYSNRCLISSASREYTLRIYHNAGFFSCCSVRLEVILFYFNQYKTLPDRIDSAEQFNQYVSEHRHLYVDLAKIYFKESDDVLISYQNPIYLVRSREGENKMSYEQFLDYRTLQFDEVAPFIRKYFTVSSRIEEIIQAIERKYNLDYENICTVYYRGTDKRQETTLASYEEFIDKARELHRKNMTFLLQTDEVGFREEFLQALPDSIVIDEVDNPNQFIHSLYLLSIIKIMSKTKHIICGSGNVSFWIVLYRGNANNVHQYLSQKEMIYGVRNARYDSNNPKGWL